MSTYIIQTTPEDEYVMANPVFLFFLALIILSIVSNITNLNLTMRNYSQLYVMPFYESCAILFNIISGLLLMGEYELYTRSQLTRVVIGCLISVIGIFLKLLSLEAFEKGSGVDKDDTFQPVISDDNEDSSGEDYSFYSFQQVTTLAWFK